MHYNDIHDADDLAQFLMHGLSADTMYRIYIDLRKRGPDVIGELDSDFDPLGLIRSHVWYVLYTAAWNLAHNLTGSETGGDDG